MCISKVLISEEIHPQIRWALHAFDQSFTQKIFIECLVLENSSGNKQTNKNPKQTKKNDRYFDDQIKVTSFVLWGIETNTSLIKAFRKHKNK